MFLIDWEGNVPAQVVSKDNIRRAFKSFLRLFEHTQMTPSPQWLAFWKVLVQMTHNNFLIGGRRNHL